MYKYNRRKQETLVLTSEIKILDASCLVAEPEVKLS